MKKVNIIVLALVAVCLLAAPLALGQGGSAEQQIAALSDQAIQAQLKDDTSFFEKYYADDATIVHSDGKLYTKAEEIANLKSGSLKYESIDMLVACRSEFVTADAAGGVGVLPLDGPSVGGVGVDVVA